MKLILDSLFIYILVYALYYFYISFKNTRNKKFRILQKYYHNAKKKNLCLILYTHNNEQKLRRMLKCLKEQDYPSANTSIFVILDNCDDNSEKIDFAPNVQKFIIKHQSFVGKKQAISILVEKLHEYSIIDAFVFLDINRYIEKDFLSTVNATLEDYDVVTGATILFGENLTIRQRIKSAYQKYKMNFLEKARACADLYTVIDSNVCAIKRAIVDNIGLPDFENLEKDLEYSLSVAKDGNIFTFNPNVKTYCEVRDFKIRIPRLSKRLNLFMDNCSKLFTLNVKFTEFVVFQLCPNIVSVLLIMLLLLNVSLKYCFVADFSVLITLICGFIIAFAVSLLNSKMRAREVFFLALYPVYSFFHVVRHFALWRFFRNILYKKKHENELIEEFEIDVEVTDGRGVAPCKLVIVNECGMSKVRFMFKNKRITTKAHLRTYDAIDELIKRLSDYGFTMKICQACVNFTSNHDGSTNLIKGFCQKQFQVSQKGEIPVVVWSTCRGFTPKMAVKNSK